MRSETHRTSLRGLAFLGLFVLAVLPVLNLRTDIAGASPTCDPYAPATCTLRQLADLAGIRIGRHQDFHDLILSRLLNEEDGLGLELPGNAARSADR